MGSGPQRQRVLLPAACYRSRLQPPLLAPLAVLEQVFLAHPHWQLLHAREERGVRLSIVRALAFLADRRDEVLSEVLGALEGGLLLQQSRRAGSPHGRDAVTSRSGTAVRIRPFFDHMHLPPDIKRDRVPAPGISFEVPNIPGLIERIRQEFLQTESA